MPPFRLIGPDHHELGPRPQNGGQTGFEEMATAKAAHLQALHSSVTMNNPCGGLNHPLTQKRPGASRTN